MGEKFNFTKETIDIKLDVPISSDRFILPKNVQVRSIDDIFKEMRKTTEKFEDDHKQWKKERKKRALIEAGRVYEEQKKYPKAIAKYTEAIELNPSESAGYNARFRLYELIGKNKKAIEDISKLIEMNLPYARGLRFSERAEIYSRIGKYQKAVNDYNRALEEERKDIKEEIKKKKEAFKQSGEDKEGMDLTRQYS